MKSYEELIELEDEGKSCKDCVHFEICQPNVDVICFGYSEVDETEAL